MLENFYWIGSIYFNNKTVDVYHSLKNARMEIIEKELNWLSNAEDGIYLTKYGYAGEYEYEYDSNVIIQCRPVQGKCVIQIKHNLDATINNKMNIKIDNNVTIATIDVEKRVIFRQVDGDAWNDVPDRFKGEML